MVGGLRIHLNAASRGFIIIFSPASLKTGAAGLTGIKPVTLCATIASGGGSAIVKALCISTIWVVD